MDALLIHLRDFNFVTVILRLLLAFLSGTIIGYGRARKRRSAGLRTFMLTSIGAALTVLLATYAYELDRAQPGLRPVHGVRPVRLCLYGHRRGRGLL